MAPLFDAIDWEEEEEKKEDMSTAINPDRNALGDDLIEALECL
jgi:hypothetical protein